MQKLHKDIFERCSDFLKEKNTLDKMDAQVVADIQNDKKEFYQADFFIRKKVSGFAGTVDLIESTDVKATGVTNMDKGELPSKSYLAIGAVGLSYGYSTSGSAAPSEIRYCNSEYLNTIPTKIINSEFELKSDDKVILRCRTKKFFSNSYADYGVEANDENAVILPSPKLASSDKKILPQLKFASDSLAAPSNYHFIEVRILGVYVGDRT